MAKAKEFRVTIEDKPAALGSCCLALAEHGEAVGHVGRQRHAMRVDKPAEALAVLRNLRANFEQDDVAVVRLAHRPGELGRAASRLGEHRININYSYCGVDPDSSSPIAVFGVDQVTNAAALLDEFAAK